MRSGTFGTKGTLKIGAHVHPPHLFQGKLLSTVGLVTKAQSYITLSSESSKSWNLVFWGGDTLHAWFPLAACSTLVFCFWQEHTGLSVCSGPAPADSSDPSLQLGLCISVKQITSWKACIWIWGLGYRQKKSVFSPKFKSLGGTGANFSPWQWAEEQVKFPC